MPAKKKYLSGGWKRFSKVTAAILGSYIVAMSVHVAVIKLAMDDTPWLLTSSYSSFLLWTGLMVLAFFIKKAWHVWGIYAVISSICSILIFTG